MGIFVFIIFSYQASALMSKDGVIQNVQTYSSNPFWQMGTNSYNQRMPTAIYATGTAIETSECQSIVATLIATQCAMRNNCISTQLSEIRPAIMLQLSRIPNGNYATACGGYIDTAFEDIKERYKNEWDSIISIFKKAKHAYNDKYSNSFIVILVHEDGTREEIK